MPSEREFEICRSKRRWLTKRDAKRQAKRDMTHGAPKMRAYSCPCCQGFHLTTGRMFRREPGSELAADGD